MLEEEAAVDRFLVCRSLWCSGGATAIANEWEPIRPQVSTTDTPRDNYED